MIEPEMTNESLKDDPAAVPVEVNNLKTLLSLLECRRNGTKLILIPTFELPDGIVV